MSCSKGFALVGFLFAILLLLFSDAAAARKLAHKTNDGIVFNPIYVKVKMEGVPIARKIDVGLYNSYQTLKTASLNKFADCSCGERGNNSNANFTLTYRDKEGEWHLAGDLPWQTFLQSVQCMKIIRRQPSN